MNARDVISNIELLSDQYGGTFKLDRNDADAIIAALTAAGLEIRPRGMVDALRSARCPSDGRHLVGECYDAKTCGCTIGLHLSATNQRDANNECS